MKSGMNSLFSEELVRICQSFRDSIWRDWDTRMLEYKQRNAYKELVK